MIKNRIIKWWYRLIGKKPDQMEMVIYWKRQENCRAKITTAEDGSTIMKLEGEKYYFPTFPRGYLLFGKLSKLKHEIKNQIFNEAWAELEDGIDKKKIIKKIKHKLKNELPVYYEPLKYDMLPENKMCPSVREIYRAWTKIGANPVIRDYLCFILQEDDGYRFRVQWLAEWFGWLLKTNPIKFFEKSLSMIEHAEVIGDMKERMRLLKRILMLVLEDESVKKQFVALFREIDWGKVRLTKGDKYHFRGKYFKVDYQLFDY